MTVPKASFWLHVYEGFSHCFGFIAKGPCDPFLFLCGQSVLVQEEFCEFTAFCRQWYLNTVNNNLPLTKKNFHINIIISG